MGGKTNDSGLFEPDWVRLGCVGPELGDIWVELVRESDNPEFVPKIGVNGPDFNAPGARGTDSSGSESLESSESIRRGIERVGISVRLVDGLDCFVGVSKVESGVVWRG